MHQLVAYSEAQDSAVLANMTAVPDGSVNVIGDNIRVPRFANMIGGVYAGGAAITQARLVSASLRDPANLDVSPIDIGAEPTVPTPFIDMFANPRQLTNGEDLRAQSAENGVADQRAVVGVFLTDGPIAPAAGEIFTVRVTGTTVHVANQWTEVPLVFDQVIPAGRYALVGAHFIAATLILSRFIIPGVAHRPGMIGYDSPGDVGLPIFRNGMLGTWAEFDTTQSLQAEVLSTAADVSDEGFLDLIFLGPLEA